MSLSRHEPTARPVRHRPLPSTATHRAPPPASILPPCRGLPSGRRQAPVSACSPPGPYRPSRIYYCRNTLGPSRNYCETNRNYCESFTSPKGCGLYLATRVQVIHRFFIAGGAPIYEHTYCHVGRLPSPHIPASNVFLNIWQWSVSHS